jgi:hypothetical protein
VETAPKTARVFDWEKAFKRLSDAVDNECLCGHCPALKLCNEDHNSNTNRCRRVLRKWAKANYEVKTDAP